jgi:O-antigen ligase
MFERERNYIFLIVVHILIGIVIFYVPFLSKIYGYLIIFGGTYMVLRNKNRSHEILLAAGYIVGSEVFLRMTDGNPVYEFSKYGVMMFILIGMYFKGFSKFAMPYWLFLTLMIPGVIVAAYSLDYDTALRKTISFNISGPLCLGLASLYTYNRKVTRKQIDDILLLVGLPIITCTVYLILYTPNIQDVITGTGSNYETSGGFGPNQVSTVLGLGMFVFFARMMFSSPTKLLFVVNLVVALSISYRGLVTFSRGGMITGVLMLLFLAAVSYFKVNQRGRIKMNIMLIFLFIVMSAVWSYSSMQTGGLIEKRYANQDAAGRVKKSQFTGREQILAGELEFFLQNPIFGIGVGKGMQLRLQSTGNVVLSHNEISRTLAEHGACGILGLLIIFATPLFLYLDNKDHIYLLCFLLFWLLTINHAAMRLAAPAFIYCLSILKVVKTDEELIVHRE